MSDNDSLDYKSAGVDIDAGNLLIERIKPHVKATTRPEVVGGLGGFGGLFALPIGKYKDPILVSGTDGVGTKLRLAIEMNLHDTIGIDLVAMCVNDIVVTGAEPLYFLDYFATGKLDVDHGEAVIKGIADGCKQAGAALIGGETAEMPGMYANGDYDVAGFSVGIVERENIIDGSQVTAGDQLIGIGSSGPHSNGYSLIRKIIEKSGADLKEAFGGTTLGEALLKPTQIYVKPLLELQKLVNVKALAHITGGGLTENLPRVLPENCTAHINLASWELPEVFKWCQNNGNISETEMLRTFNCGVGMIVCVAADEVEKTLNQLNESGLSSWHIGEISPAKGDTSIEYHK